ncbi:hypothetical protein BX286_4027 [Streptomyces sp. 3211.6]|uniref:DUF2637 domain-containing protein n=1 Tax=Streptomyces TaxID=1883 RepID=UPI0009A54445|nr:MULTISPECIES: DUF2637 domain-containing protein [Streptomyces]RKT05994.1 hypothetical protein BX286_4027 [Streptomyces sp. 3211.6]RPF46466.1 hypothetical protein EDD96_3041 [Streptomyces sp. Ag109_G2-6]
MNEQYGHYAPQPEPTAFWQEPDLTQQTAYGYPLFGLGEANAPWDPAEELAHLCREAMAPSRAEPLDQLAFGETGETGETVSGAGLASGLSAGFTPPLAPGLSSGPAGGGFSPGAGQRPRTPAPGGHRRGSRAKTSVVALLRTGSLCTAVLVAVIAAVVSMYSGLAVCEALRHSAGPRTAHDVAGWWPLLIYGPWMVASLSILRAALHQRRAVHSWSVVLLFSTLATLLCVAQAPRTLAAQAAATLPPIAALACFQQLVRQITLTRPPRQLAPRHRNSRPAQLRPQAAAGGPDAGLPDYPVRDWRESLRASTGYRIRYGS